MSSPNELSSERTDWRTPPYIFEWLDREFHFTLDAAASPENALIDRYLTVESNALFRDWDDVPFFRPDVAFVNPPYGKVGHAFLRKAWEQAVSNGVTSVLLVPPSTGTFVWHQYVSRAAEIRFLRPRIAFLDEYGEPQKANTRDSCLVIFRPGRRTASPLLSFVERPLSLAERKRRGLV